MRIGPELAGAFVSAAVSETGGTESVIENFFAANNAVANFAI
jgi:hypothetical protein